MTDDVSMDGEQLMILCCQCGVSIPPNPINTCVQCLQTRYDIGAGVAKQVQQHTCRGCDRYERRDSSWAAVEPESKELLALLLKKPRGLGAVRLADASFIWTEPHSKRLKLRVTIQKEVVAGAVLQQTFVIEFVLGNKQCPHCQRREAKDTWMAVVQVRQKVPHKRTFLWLEQLILKHSAHSDAVNVGELKDGLDFYFDQRSHAEKLVSFLQSVSPTRYKTSEQLVSQDVHTGKGKTKLTYSVEVLPVCKEDVVWLPRATAASLGHLSQLALCYKVSNVLHFVDPISLQVGELQPLAYWKKPFKGALSRSDLVEFVVLDLELRDPEWQLRGRSRARRSVRDTWALADVTVARRSDFGHNDRRESTVTHLGNILKVGDYVWGYCVAATSVGGEVEDADLEKLLPEVMLVKKSYSDRRRKSRRRLWRLRQLEKESEPGVQRGRHMDTTAYEAEYEEFMQELEEDPGMRSQVHLYRDENAIEAEQERQEAIAAERERAARHAAAAGGGGKDRDISAAVEVDESAFGDDEAEGDEDDDFPAVGLEELLDELTIGGAGEAEEGGNEAGGSGDGVILDSTGPQEVAPVSFAPGFGEGGGSPNVAQFTLPGGNDNAKFHF